MGILSTCYSPATENKSLGNVSVLGKGKAGGSNAWREKGMDRRVGKGRNRRMLKKEWKVGETARKGVCLCTKKE